MYISGIDDILEDTLNKFIEIWVIDTKTSKSTELLNFSTLIKESNFVKYQKEINNILEFGMSLISQKEITKFVTKNNNIIVTFTADITRLPNDVRTVDFEIKGKIAEIE